MGKLTVIGRNGIAVSKTIDLNFKKFIKYQDNLSGKAEVRYDAGPGLKPEDLVLSISKSALDVLIVADNSVSLIEAAVLNLGTGIRTSTSINESYVSALVDGPQRVGSSLDSSTVEITYSDGSFGVKKIYADGTISSLVFKRPAASNKKQYTAFLSQEAGADPVAFLLEDSVAGVWKRTGVGVYTYTKAGAFTVNKTTPNKATEYSDLAGNKFVVTPTSVDVFTLETYSAANTSVLADGVLDDQYIHFEIFK